MLFRKQESPMILFDCYLNSLHCVCVNLDLRCMITDSHGAVRSSWQDSRWWVGSCFCAQSLTLVCKTNRTWSTISKRIFIGPMSLHNVKWATCISNTMSIWCFSKNFTKMKPFSLSFKTDTIIFYYSRPLLSKNYLAVFLLYPSSW